jgi:hypothetical protein
MDAIARDTQRYRLARGAAAFVIARRPTCGCMVGDVLAAEAAMHSLRL